jgi:hypothetical protein
VLVLEEINLNRKFSRDAVDLGRSDCSYNEPMNKDSSDQESRNQK